MKKKRKNSLTSKWCFLRDDYRIKTLIKNKIKERKLKLVTLAEMTGIDTYRISRYLNQKHIDGLPSVTQYQLIKICNTLGIEVSLSIKLKEDDM